MLINNKVVWLYPKVSTIIADWPEATTFCLTYKLTNSNYPCYFCLVDKKNLASTKCFKHDLFLRNHENMRNYFENGDEIYDINIYKATIIDRMYHLDLGLFKHQINFTLDLLKEQYSASILDKIDYSSVTLENRSIIQATEDFYSKAWYSNVKVAMNSEVLLEYLLDDGICYGQIYLLLNVETTEESMLNLALIQWYDFKSTNDPYYYGCSRLKKTKLYNIIDIEAIKNHVHIIPCFDKSNDYLVISISSNKIKSV
ncbi:zn-finger domain-containing protein [Gigaspora margarita]|uniref:Zn-finger domain-containing protein n=1 Tax=Gigaspora margarita TaxID=4874 RepID=A0A8H3X9J0_GIGMA|nr:zn-finger domain-containing protein [Gigaspora margarita]